MEDLDKAIIAEVIVLFDGKEEISTELRENIVNNVQRKDILAGRLCSGGSYVLTEQMCIIFATCFILRGRDVDIDFLQFVSGQHDLPSDAIAFSLMSFENM